MYIITNGFMICIVYGHLFEFNYNHLVFVGLNIVVSSSPTWHCSTSYCYSPYRRINNNQYPDNSFFTKGIILFKIMDSWSASVSNDTIRIG